MPECPDCPSQAEFRDRDPAEPAVRWRAPRRQVPLDGILNVDKPPGITSHDVVDVIRRVSGQRRVGHAGTLDPMATGVLLVCLGQATRVAEYLMAHPKRYRATVLLGIETDTFDLDGRVVASGGTIGFSQGELEAAVVAYRGEVWQVPPMYSALKRDGQPLHRLARQGKTVERKARPIHIYEMLLVDWTPPELILEVECSPGTYVRSLAHDLGQRLGCGAALAALVRMASGRFTLEMASSLGRLEEAFERGQEADYLLPMDEALLEWPAIIVDHEDSLRMRHGQGVASAPLADPKPGDVGDPPLARAYDLDGNFLAVVAFDGEAGLWRPKKVFATGPEHKSA